MQHINIAIDGPAGAGKSTIAKAIAKKRNLIYVDTGAMYRAIALYFLRKGIASDDVEAIEQEIPKVDVSIHYENGEQIVMLNGENVNSLIRTQEVGNMASTVSVHKKVREKLVELQRALAAKTSVVMDGRDIGTTVLPDAKVKIYLTASADVRARRRQAELAEKGMLSDFETVQREILDRDKRDMTRKHSPLCKAEDAVEVDTSDMTMAEAVEAIDAVVTEREQIRAGK